MSHSADNPRGSARPTKWRRVLAAAVAAAAVGLVGPATASALPGLHRAAAKTEGSTARTQHVTAKCEADEDVVGGGGSVHGSDPAPPRITGMMPEHVEGGPDGWRVAAELPAGVGPVAWNVFAYAVCVQEWALDNYWLETATIGSTKDFKSTGAECPGDTVAWGSGASINGFLTSYGDHRVGLQMYRTSGKLDISRASARAETSYGGFWTLYSTAICADPVNFVTAVGQVFPGSQGNVYCDQVSPFYRVHGVGGGGSPVVDGGQVWLRQVKPDNDLSLVRVELSGPLSPSVGGMVASATCAA
jgi:hypothetical protein